MTQCYFCKRTISGIKKFHITNELIRYECCSYCHYLFNHFYGILTNVTKYAFDKILVLSWKKIRIPRRCNKCKWFNKDEPSHCKKDLHTGYDRNGNIKLDTSYRHTYASWGCTVYEE